MALTTLAQQPITPQRIQEFDNYVETVRRQWEVPGLSIVVVKDKQVIFKKGYGVRELGKPESVDTQTLFACASTTKAMTDSSKYSGGRLVKPSTWVDMFTPQTLVPDVEYGTMQVLKPNWFTYGLGWYQHDYRAFFIIYSLC